MKINITILLLIFFSTGFSQTPENAYRTSNPHYWKKRKPHESYWQQDVHYRIKASVDEKLDQITANEKLTYWNNSPDTLYFVFFHLYQNAFQPGSYLDDLQKNNNFHANYGPYESKGLGTIIKKIQSDGKDLKTILDNTILKVFLDKPILPGGQMDFEIDFQTFFDRFGNSRRRMKLFNSWGFKHYDGVLWYPRISVYDRKFGWNTDQHLNREFYGDFGTFDVELDFSSNFILDGTGVLLNEAEVLPADLKARLDIKNFQDKPLYSKPSVIIPYDSLSRKTWKFHAENVHDFAFTADPTYRIGEVTWNGIRCIALAQEPHASRWQNAASYTARIIETYSKDFGMYLYPKMIVADARDGMEYPMLTLDGGLDPDYRDLFAHEVGHNWFYGMIGSNETYRAFMDEGFTQFLTSWFMEKEEGKEIPVKTTSWYLNKFKEPENVKNSQVYFGYLRDAIQNKDAFLNTHSDAFNGAIGQGGGYGHVYFKTAAMLYNLQYVLGDSLFLNSMRHYFDQWKICHPYPEDMRNSFIEYSHVDLNWFFDQWLETNKNIDYKIEKVERHKRNDSYDIVFRRKGRMQMPIDFTVYGKDGSQSSFHIPNNWFVKNTTATVLPKWYGWDYLNKTYKARIKFDKPIQNIKIDTTGLLADVNLLDNSLKLPVSIKFDSRINNKPDQKEYRLFARPDLWYNAYDGVKAGFHLNGNYMDITNKLHASFWLNSGLLQQGLPDNGRGDTRTNINKYDGISFNLEYNTPARLLKENFGFISNIRHLDGLDLGMIGLNRFLENGKIYSYFKGMVRSSSTSDNYLLFPDQWLLKKYNNTFHSGITNDYFYENGTCNVKLDFNAPAPASDYDYAYLDLEIINKKYLGTFEFAARIYGRYGTGQKIPFESALYLSGGSPENMMENKYTRSRGFYMDDWTGYGTSTNHFNYGGGLGIRGYSGYLAADEDNSGNLILTYYGTGGAAVNLELEFDQILTLMPGRLRKTFKFDSYLFTDAGIINKNKTGAAFNASWLRADGGIGTALTIKQWGRLQNINPLTIRFDMPLILNAPPATENYFEPRWIIAINRAF